ncbi:MAG: ankyrin repeat domain-containing protein [Pseudoxanthomonas suwonensis]|nr:ankyrin repeat domain-containing protein [Pseudoxanthomonas suwonensis]
MPEPLRPTRAIAAAAVLAAIATLATGLGGVVAAVGGWLAQPAWALAVRWWRGGDDVEAPTRWRADAPALLLLWGAAVAVTVLLLAVPVSRLLAGGSLGAAVATSAVVGALLMALWRLWPLWHGLERHGGTLRQRWTRLQAVEPGSWHGLVAATVLLAVLAPVLLLAWPGLLPNGWRWTLALLLVPVWPALHVALQRMRGPSPSMSAIALAHLQALQDDAAPSIADADHADDVTSASTTPVAPAGPAAIPTPAQLYAAARGGRVEHALQLLDAGADAHAPPPAGDRDRRSLAVLAAVLPDLRLLRALIARGVNLNAVDSGLTPLLAATRDSWHGRPEAVMTLLANGADPRVSDADGNTPMHHAARSSDPGVAALLRDAAAELDRPNHDGVTPLGMACASGNWRLAKFLLERGARAHLPGSVPALLSAAGGEDDDDAGVLLLLKHRAQLAATDAGGRTALHEAARAGHPGIVEALLAAGADARTRDAQSRTPLLDGARSGRINVIDALHAAGATVDVVDARGHGALVHALEGGHATPALLQRLMELGADAALAGKDGRRPVDLAAEAGRWALVAVLDPDYPLPGRVLDEAREQGDADSDALPDRSPQSLLHEALSEDRFDPGLPAIARLLEPAELGRLLLDPAMLAAPARLAWLLAHGADPQTRDGNGDNVLFAQLRRGPAALPQLRLLLGRGQSPGGRGGLATYLAAAVESGSLPADRAAAESLALQLLDGGADAFAAAGNGDPPLALAVRLGWERLADALIARGADPDARDSHGMTALHLAAALGRERLLRRLVASGAAADIRAADGQTPLGIALAAGCSDLADWLDWRAWQLPGRPLRASDVPAAAIVGDAGAVRRLLSLGLPVDAVDAQGCSALLRAAGGGHVEVIDLLLGKGADVQLAARTGATPLSAAVSMRQMPIVERLLAAGAPLEARLPGGITVLMLACALGLPDVVERLLLAGADIGVRDDQGLGCLHCAGLFGFTATDRARLLALLDTLLLADADPDAEAAGGVTPLLLLLGARAEPGSACDESVVMAGVERLLDEQVRLDVRDPRGFGPLHLTALHGLLEVTRLLLRAGADPEQRDGLNRPPRDIALMRGFVDVAAEFAPPTPGNVSMARFLREPR